MSELPTETVERLQTRLASISYEGISVKDSQKGYNDWAATYEKDLLACGYSSPLAVCKCICDKFPPQSRLHSRILDVGAGTGLVAKELRKHGFHHIDGLDPQEAMLDEARKLDLYENYFVNFISETPLDIRANTYDALTASSVFGKDGHVPSEALVEMIRLVKPGGFISISTRQNSDIFKRLETQMNQLEADGKWKQVTHDTWPRFYLDITGVCWCYEVL